MKSELQLDLDDKLVSQISEYAAGRNQSFSEVVEDALRFFVQQHSLMHKTPLVVDELRGILKHQQLDEREYQRHLEEKYL